VKGPGDAPLVVIVTGASSGIGLATAKAYASRHAHLVLVARGEDLLGDAADACRALGAASATPVRCDVRDGEAVRQVVARAVADHGRIDVVVHAAMVMAYGGIEALPEEIYTAVVDTAVHGTAHVARAVLPVFRDQAQGALVIVTSLLASVAVPGLGAYTVGKWGQLGLARILRLETRDVPGVRVVTVAPGAVDTPVFRRAANVEGRPGKAPPPVVPPEKVAAVILAAVEGGRRRRSVGVTNLIVIAGFRCLGPLYERLVGPLYRRYAHGPGTIPPTSGNVLTHSTREDREAEVR
jgi:NAD(P)-dependent dehydrogenase (short-subunit alcohol dehydrogenase family)